MFIYPIYNHNWRIISAIYVYITRLASNEIFSPSNKIHGEVGRAKDLSASLYTTDFHFRREDGDNISHRNVAGTYACKTADYRKSKFHIFLFVCWFLSQILAVVFNRIHTERRNIRRSCVRYGLQPKAVCFLYFWIFIRVKGKAVAVIGEVIM